MIEIGINVLLTSTILSIVLWISKTNPVLGGFIVSLPISSIIVLAFSKLQSVDEGNTMIMAKSIFIAIPASLTFFIPFLFADKLKMSFWTTYGSGLALLLISFTIHRWVMNHWMS